MSEAKHYKTAPEDVIPLSQKVYFGMGSLAMQLYVAVMSVFTVVLVMGLNMNPLLAGILTFVPRLVDALTDPIMGYITDNTRTRWGRRRPYIFIGAILSGITYMAMWQIYPENSTVFNFFYFLFMSIAYYLGYTIFSTPLVALGYEMSPDYHERTSIMATSQWIGQIAWMIAPWAWVVIFMDSLWDSPADGSRKMAAWIGAISILLALIPAIFSKERELASDNQISRLTWDRINENLQDFFKSIKETFQCRPFVILCISTFLIFNAYMAITQFQYFIFVHYVFGGNDALVGTYPAWYGTIAACATAFMVIPIVAFMSKKIGKRNAFVVAMSISVVGYLLKFWFFSPTTPWLIFLTLPLTSFGIGGLFTLMMAMTSDVCDIDELNYGQRREGMFGAVYWWFVKLGTAFSFLVSFATLYFAGYDESPGAMQTEQTMTLVRLADAIIPAVGTALGIFTMLKYDVDEAKSREIRSQLEARPKK